MKAFLQEGISWMLTIAFEKLKIFTDHTRTNQLLKWTYVLVITLLVDETYN